MSPRTLELIDSLPAVEDDGRWWDACIDGLRDRGVESVCYCVAPFTCGAVPRDFAASVFVRSTHPEEWVQTVLDTGLLEQDLTAELALAGTDVVPWSDESLWDHASPEQRRLSELEKDLGMDVGATLALRRGDSGMLSGIGLRTPHVEPEAFDGYWAEHGDEIGLLASLLDDGLVGERSKLIVKLSPREHDVVTLLAAGYRPGEIARRLHRSPKTINNVVEQAKRRLKARTRDHAVAKAVWLGLVAP